ncbi:hypothetical protein [Hymenobacter gummosus]|nr:hypothetical protein [Hymenobacter gummosus]
MPVRHYPGRLLGLAVLLSLSSYAAGQGSPPVGPTDERAAKGRIWAATAKHLWRVAPRLPQNQLPQLRTADDFDEWLSTKSGKELAEKSGLSMLKGIVVDSMRIRNGASTGTPAQVAQAILHTVEKEQSKPGNIKRLAQIKGAKLDSLRQDLRSYLPAAATQTATGHPSKIDSDAADAVNGTGPGAAEPPPPAEPQYITTYITPLGLPLPVFSTLLLAAGGILGVVGYRVLLGKPRGSSKSSKNAPTVSETSDEMHPSDLKKLKREIQQLKGDKNLLSREVQQLTKDKRNLEQQLAELQAPLAFPAMPDITASVNTSQNLITDAAPPEPVPAPAAPQPTTTLYGPVQEMPFVEERKFVETPLPQLALMMTVNPRTPDQASFTLNPQVDQSMLIGDGLSRLQQFFDYDMPAGRINAVAAAAPGQLRRQAGGWQVLTRARLHVR